MGRDDQKIDDNGNAILSALNQGCSLRYLFMEGSVAVHGPDGTPSRDQQCSIETFLDLRAQGLIDQTRHNVIGDPYYADNQRSDEYKITEEGRQTLSPKPSSPG